MGRARLALGWSLSWMAMHLMKARGSVPSGSRQQCSQQLAVLLGLSALSYSRCPPTAAGALAISREIPSRRLGSGPHSCEGGNYLRLGNVLLSAELRPFRDDGFELRKAGWREDGVGLRRFLKSGGMLKNQPTYIYMYVP